MAAPNGYPSWVYNRSAPAVVVYSQAAFEALDGTWGPTPYPGNPSIQPLPPPPGTVQDALLAILFILTQRLPAPVVHSLRAALASADESDESAESPDPEPKHRGRRS